MKRVMLLVLIAAMLLISAEAMSERVLYDISLEDNQYFINRGGVAYISGPDIAGSCRIEARVLLQNIKEYCLGYQAPMLYLYQNGKCVREIEAVTVTPESAAPKGYTLLTFSGMDIELDGFEGIKLSIISNVQRTEEKEEYIGSRSGTLEPYEFSAGKRMRVDLSDLEEGIYAVNVIAFDQHGRLAWAEDAHANRELYGEVTAGIEDHEMALLVESGKEPTAVYGIIYREK